MLQLEVIKKLASERFFLALSLPEQLKAECIWCPFNEQFLACKWKYKCWSINFTSSFLPKNLSLVSFKDVLRDKTGLSVKNGQLVSKSALLQVYKCSAESVPAVKNERTSLTTEPVTSNLPLDGLPP